MNVTQCIKFSFSATKSFIVFIIKIWKIANKHEKAEKKILKHLKKETKT